MDQLRIRLGHGVPDLAALGAREPLDLFEPWNGAEPRLLGVEAAGASTVGEFEGCLRYPLPGTPDAEGRLRGSPRGAGTGWVELRRYRGGSWRSLLGARFTTPQSGSLAERAWNLACHLRAHGVGTPELMAVGARGRGLVARDSFLVTRALEGLVPLDEWARQGAAPAACARVARALGVALSALFRCGAWLPELSARDVMLSAAEAGVAPEGDACAADVIHVARAARSVDVPMPNRLPGVVLRGLDGGRILPRVELGRRIELCARLSREAPGALSERQRAGVLLRALADLPPEQVRRAMRSAAVARA